MDDLTLTNAIPTQSVREVDGASAKLTAADLADGGSAPRCIRLELCGLVVQVILAILFVAVAIEEIVETAQLAPASTIASRMSHFRPSLLKFPYLGYYIATFFLIGLGAIAMAWHFALRSLHGSSKSSEDAA